ncbi:hypothetical protein PHLGIDRAFT_381671 [Phlebiopsis gigantea 11061_1 CR5-6]|uniref:Uncharacterized protein n=1 Tax=Phlebiopsis gigantea (strain 11061_1 CR5-6) TaxID=745531 RepID=A0A0C3S9M1_PHLG1|nr:hypothetical protein PHLGIDRAFT_381671 [Phlebiopsis gigantea 11061_1 CR5-6]
MCNSPIIPSPQSICVNAVPDCQAKGSSTVSLEDDWMTVRMAKKPPLAMNVPPSKASSTLYRWYPRGRGRLTTVSRVSPMPSIRPGSPIPANTRPSPSQPPVASPRARRLVRFLLGRAKA